MGPGHVPQHGPRIRPTTWAPNTSHNMGPEHVSQHGPRARPTTFEASLFYTCHIAAPFVDGCLKQLFSTHAKIAAPFVDGCLKHFFSTHAKISAPFVDGCLTQFFSTSNQFVCLYPWRSHLQSDQHFSSQICMTVPMARSFAKRPAFSVTNLYDCTHGEVMLKTTSIFGHQFV